MPRLGGNLQEAGLLKIDLAPAATPLPAQNIAPVAYVNQDIVMTPINHGTFVMKWGAKTIYCDPVGGAATFQAFPKPDLIVITHTHPDHFHVPTLEAVSGPNTAILVPKNVFDSAAI